MVRRRIPSQCPTLLSGNGSQSYTRSRVLVRAVASRPLRLVHESVGEPSGGRSDTRPVAVGRRPAEAQHGKHQLVRARSRAGAGILAVVFVTALVSHVSAAVALRLPDVLMKLGVDEEHIHCGEVAGNVSASIACGSFGPYLHSYGN